jgi:hypothetical protein
MLYLGLLIRRSQVRILPGAPQKEVILQGNWDVQVYGKSHGRRYLPQRAVMGTLVGGW